MPISKIMTRTALSLEYAILGLLSPDYKIEPWTPFNTLTWGKAMAWDLRGNMDEEIERAVLLKTLTPEQVDELFPAYPDDHPVIVNKIGDGSSAQSQIQPHSPLKFQTKRLMCYIDNIALLDHCLGHLSDGIGSNSWAVSEAHSQRQACRCWQTIHILRIQMPSIWYQIGLHCMTQKPRMPV